MLKKITEEEAIKIYNEYLQFDFKDEEIPSFTDYKKMIGLEGFETLIYEENEEQKAYILQRKKEKDIMIFFFAVLKQYRGQGIGSKCIKELKQYAGNRNVIIEVETEENAKNSEENMVIKSRIKFYEKLGFEKIKNIKYNIKGHPYYLMTLEKNIITEEIINKVKAMYDVKNNNSKWMKIEIIK